jgi:3-oxoacyl-[acyl-carrier-protein] synthase II
MAIAAAREAMQGAGLNTETLSLDEQRAIAVILGTGAGGIEFAERQYAAFYGRGERHVTPYCVSSSFVGMLSSEVSIALGLRGPSHVLSTGCTSSTDAMGYALQAVRSGAHPVVLTGGAEACITPGILAGFARMRVVATRYNSEPEKAGRPFDKERDGFVLGEGAWMFVVEDAEHARRRGARVLAELAGYGSTCEAYHRVVMNSDGVESARAMGLAVESAGAQLADVDCVNLHGTGTQMNDVIETRALKLLLGKRALNLPASATKSMIGHPQGACGAAGAMAGLFSLLHQYIPPTINYATPDPECDLDYTPNAGRAAAVRAVLCNTIAFGSKNAALLLRSA